MEPTYITISPKYYIIFFLLVVKFLVEPWYSSKTKPIAEVKRKNDIVTHGMQLSDTSQWSSTLSDMVPNDPSLVFYWERDDRAKCSFRFSLSLSGSSGVNAFECWFSVECCLGRNKTWGQWVFVCIDNFFTFCCYRCCWCSMSRNNKLINWVSRVFPLKTLISDCFLLIKF